jgi:YesN/AraC family two-component response regulator
MEDIALQDIAGVFAYSDVYFCKLFKQNFGMNFITYLNEYRMNRAKEMLADPAINIKDISSKAGYRDANYFTRVFKRMVGMTPSEYRSGVMSNG